MAPTPPTPRAVYPDLSAGASSRSPKELAAALWRRFPFFRRVPKPVVAELAAAARVRRCRKGDRLCSVGDGAREVWALLDGRVSINRCGWSGQKVSIEIMVPGEVFGLSALVCTTYPSEVEATRESVVAVFPKENFQRQVGRCAVLAQEVLLTLGQRMHYVETMFLLSQERVDRRLAAALVYLSHKFGSTIPLNRIEVAEMAGTTPETAKRRLKLLEARGWLRREEGALEIKDLQAIKDSLS